jgi:hypothetical protein
MAVDAVMTAQPRPPRSSAGKLSRTDTSPAAFAETPWLNALP